MSTIKQAAVCSAAEAKNSSAEPKPSTTYPADSTQSPSACRTNTSSSIITTLLFIYHGADTPLQIKFLAVQPAHVRLRVTSLDIGIVPGLRREVYCTLVEQHN